jgi:hypothetical protein
MTVQMPNLTLVVTKRITVYTKLTIPRKQRTKACLQIDTEHASEAICCPIFKGTVSRDLNILISTFCACADGVQGLFKAFHYLYNY